MKTCANCGKNMYRKKAYTKYLKKVICLECGYKGYYFNNLGEVDHSQKTSYPK